jgi:exonuclease SbcC
MKLQRLQIHQLPGFTQSVTLDHLDPGIHFVSGPNASGKSSLIRALRHLLQPPRPEDPKTLSLSAVFNSDGQRLEVQRSGSAVTWTKDGEPSAAPGLPASDSLGSYFITLEDLFIPESTGERALAAALRRELHGGFDLAKLRNEDFRLHTQVGVQQRIRLQQARQRLQGIERQYEQTRLDEDRLPSLDQRIEQAGNRRKEAVILARIQDWRRAEDERQQIQTLLHQYPAEMDHLSGHERERLRELDSSLEKLEQQLRQARSLEEQANAQLLESGLSDDRPTREALMLQRDRITTLQRLQEQLAELEVALATAERKLSRIQTQLQIDPTTPAAHLMVDSETLNRIETLALAIEPLRQQQSLLQQRMAAISDTAVSEAMLARQQEVIGWLRDWLHKPAMDARKTRPLAFAAAASGSITLIGVLLAIANLAVGMILAGLGSILSLISAYVWFRMTRRDERADTDPLAEALRLAGVDPPAEWTRPAVLEHLRKQEEILREWQEQSIQQREHTRLAAELQIVEGQLHGLDTQRAGLAEAHGFDPLLPAFSLAVFLRHLQEWRLARDESEKLESRREAVRDTMRTTHAGIAAFLQRWQAHTPPWEQITAAEEMLLGLQHLQHRSELASAAQNERSRAQQELRRIGQEIRSHHAAISRLLQTAGLPETGAAARQELEQRLERLKDWRAKRQALRDTELLLQERMRQLPEDGPWRDLALHGDDAEIEQQRLQAADEGEQFDRLQTERNNILATVHQAGLDRKLEAALADTEQVHAEFADIRDSVLDASAAHFLLDDIEREYRQDHEPQLLRDARDLFMEFTHHAWDLNLSDDAESGFIAIETARNLPQPLRRLSTATRMQLLLAVRIARTQHEEKDRMVLPLFLDETLTTSDHARATAMIEALQRLTEQHDRQIVYLASGLYELDLWEQVTGHRPAHVDLGVLRGQTLAQPGMFLPEAWAVPEPVGLDAAAYASLLQVPAIDPFRKAEEVHVFYLLTDDLELMHRLLYLWRVRALGALVALLERPDAAEVLLPDPKARQNLGMRCRLISAWVDLCRVGRGKPLDRGALEQALEEKRGITNHTIEEVHALAMQHQLDARMLINALEQGSIRRFRTVQREKLREFLEEQGYLDPRPPVNAAARREKILTRYHASLGLDATGQIVDWLEASIRQDLRFMETEPEPAHVLDTGLDADPEVRLVAGRDSSHDADLDGDPNRCKV